MFHEIDFVRDSTGKSYVKKVVFDIGDALEDSYDLMNGYEGRSFQQLVDDGEIRLSATDCGIASSVDCIRFNRPISINRFLMMFNRVIAQKTNCIEELIQSDAENGVYSADPKKYVF
jgi:hypothetical protein